MKFQMPEIGRREIDVLTKKVLDNCCFWLSEARQLREAGKDDKSAAEYAQRLTDEYYAWVNWTRQTWPNESSGYMIQDESERYGAAAPFDPEKGDTWVHDGTRWNIMRDGKIVKGRKEV